MISPIRIVSFIFFKKNFKPIFTPSKKYCIPPIYILISIWNFFMLHTSELVAIPPDPGYNQQKGQYVNRFIYLKHYRVLVNGISKVRHDVLLIGRVVTDLETNVQCLMPNDNYYSLTMALNLIILQL